VEQKQIHVYSISAKKANGQKERQTPLDRNSELGMKFPKERSIPEPLLIPCGLWIEPNLPVVLLPSQSYNTAAVSQLASSHIIEIFIGRPDLSILVNNLEIVQLGLPV